MEWVQWLIPLMALAVWILSNLARTREEEPRRTRPPQARSETTAPPRRPPPGDREEMHRRDSVEANKKKPESRRPQREEPRRPPPQPARVEAPRRPSPPPPPLPLPPIVVASETVPLAKADDVVVARIVTTAGRSPEHSPAAAQLVPLSGELSPAQQLMDLLGKKEHLATAMLLREVLEAPLAKRSLVKPPAYRK